MDLLKDLNEAQRAAVEYIDGPSLVIAGAGSGKTRVLTYKIAYLLSQGMKPWSIMALTFTNKAAREMKERIGKLVGNDLAQHLYMGTFHSIFSRILRAEAEHIGFNNNFTIYDESDSRSLIKAIVKEMERNRQKLNGRLPPFCQVATIEIVPEEFQKTPTRKIKRFLYAGRAS